MALEAAYSIERWSQARKRSCPGLGTWTNICFDFENCQSLEPESREVAAAADYVAGASVADTIWRLHRINTSRRGGKFSRLYGAGSRRTKWVVISYWTRTRIGRRQCLALEDAPQKHDCQQRYSYSKPGHKRDSGVHHICLSPGASAPGFCRGVVAGKYGTTSNTKPEPEQGSCFSARNAAFPEKLVFSEFPFRYSEFPQRPLRLRTPKTFGGRLFGSGLVEVATAQEEPACLAQQFATRLTHFRSAVGTKTTGVGRFGFLLLVRGDLQGVGAMPFRRSGGIIHAKECKSFHRSFFQKSCADESSSRFERQGVLSRARSQQL